MKTIILFSLMLLMSVTRVHAEETFFISESIISPDLSVEIGESKISPDITVQIGKSNVNADFSVGISHKKEDANIILTDSSYNPKYEIEMSNSIISPDLTIEVGKSKISPDVTIDIKRTGKVNYTVYSESGLLSLNKLTVCLLPAITKHVLDKNKNKYENYTFKKLIKVFNKK